MKKLLILLALAACAACNTEDDNDNRQTATFEGTLTITSNQTPSATPFVTNNISFELTEDNSGLFKLTMYNVRFAQSMPMSLNIVIPELKYEDSDNDGIYELTSTADPIIPYIGGKPYYDPQTVQCVRDPDVHRQARQRRPGGDLHLPQRADSHGRRDARPQSRVQGNDSFVTLHRKP